MFTFYISIQVYGIFLIISHLFIFYYNKNKQNTPAFTNITRYLILIKSVSLIYVVRRVFTTTYSFVLTKSKTFWRFFDLPLHRRVPRLIDSAIRQRNVFHLYEELTSSFKEYTGESTCTVMYTSRSVFTIATKLRNVTSIVFPKKNVFALFFDVVIDRLFGTWIARQKSASRIFFTILLWPN